MPVFKFVWNGTGHYTCCWCCCTYIFLYAKIKILFIITTWRIHFKCIKYYIEFMVIKEEFMDFWDDLKLIREKGRAEQHRQTENH